MCNQPMYCCRSVTWRQIHTQCTCSPSSPPSYLSTWRARSPCTRLILTLPCACPPRTPSHGPPSGPLKPALHRHAAAVALADAEYELAGHPTHALADVAFVVAKYLPLAQLVHAADPVDAL